MGINTEVSTAYTASLLFGCTLSQRSWENQDGEKRSKVEIVADEVAPSLRWASADIRRNEFKGGGGASAGGGGGRSVPNEAPPAYDMDEEPF